MDYFEGEKKRERLNNKVKLDEKQKYLESNHYRLKGELGDIQNNILNLEIKNGKYEFLLEGIDGISYQQM